MVYNYTKPRAPIAATFNSPGPCYALPSLVGYDHHDPRSAHMRGPAYPLSGRHATGRQSFGPGPAGYVPESKMLRTGRDGVPRYSLYGRHDRSTGHLTPGPGAYAPENVGPSARRSITPSYTFGLKHRNRSTDDLPAPNQYKTPSLLCRSVVSGKRRAPCYSISGRSNAHHDLHQTPGPGSYRVTELGTFKTRSARHTIAGRTSQPTDDTRKPGPGAHSPERFWPHKTVTPSFTFGIRHSPYAGSFIIPDD